MSFKSIPFVLVCLIAASVAQCQETVVEIDFDNSQAKYVSSYVFGGYGPADGSDLETVDDQFSCTQSEDASNGRLTQLAEAKKQLSEAKKNLGSGHPEVEGLQKKFEKMSAVANKCSKLVFDTSAAKIPDDAAFDYVGVGMGVTLDMTGKPFAFDSLGSYSILFDAKVTGAESLTQSKLMMKFVTDDGDDEGDASDMLLQLVKGEEDGTDTFEINSEYQTFTISLDSMIKSGGKIADLKDAKLTGINVNVQAQGNMSDFGIDDDNVLYVDNIRLIKK